MEKYFRMVTHIEHDWGTYLAGAWSLGPTLLVYLSDGFWMACAIFYKEHPQVNHQLSNQACTNTNYSQCRDIIGILYK
jgi:hypothetical protein